MCCNKSSFPYKGYGSESKKLAKTSSRDIDPDIFKS